ncbi:uncharacterized protein LOC111717231 [Eurytemora carolleeae]|uniref:uncharacterized protein LOC111717231 n=1 Tax=Eurytemora carolleeae TaxID=1294199 RepID=UPI000C75F95B|nr:uncharacterized protein LOC111717231 [Eurytemora carolleeae]|eukprot:XP_023348511.1 uncharacterized protein LOC111717231 [Eurytemora affinis]
MNSSGPQPEYIECNAGNSHDILRTTLEKNYPDKEEPVVILCNNVSSVFADIKGKMMSGDPENQRNVIQYSIESMTSDQRLEQRDTLLKYLQQPEGVLVTDIVTFAGMQARNIIVFEPDTLLSPRRNMLLRATTSLVYIKGATPIPLSS